MASRALIKAIKKQAVSALSDPEFTEFRLFNGRKWLHDMEHELAALSLLAEKGDKKAKKAKRALLAELRMWKSRK